MPSSPNILWIYGEDLSPDLSCYGVPVVQTPNLDRLASEGARYPHTFVTAPVCSASRSALITGRYQTSFGAHHHRSNRNIPLSHGIRILPEIFRDAGYFTCNSPGPPYNRPGKTDFNFKCDAPFDGIDWSQRAPGQPFYAQINIPDTHRDFKPDPENPIDPATVELPPYYPDHPLVRKDWALYLESIQLLDKKIGAILQRLDSENLADNTVIFFLSDHGRGHIRCKQFLYDGGIRIPLIVRWPGHIAPGTVAHDLISGIDLAPTSLHLANIDPDPGMEGHIFLGPNAAPPRDAVFAARDRCDGTTDRLRCIRTSRYKYIRNGFPDRPYMQFNRYKTMQYPLWSLIKVLRKQGQLLPEQARFTAETRPEEELYDLRTDPHECRNLASEPAHLAVRTDLGARLDAWIDETGDRGQIPEDPAALEAEIRTMNERFQQNIHDLGFNPDANPEAYVAYWQQKLLG